MEQQHERPCEPQERPQQGAAEEAQPLEQRQRQLGHHAGSNCSWPLLTLPDLAMEAVMAHLPQHGRQCLRQACKGALACVDACTKQLSAHFRQLPAPSAITRASLAVRFSSLQRLRIHEGTDMIYSGVSQAEVLGLGHISAPWSSVTSLEFGSIAAASAAALVPVFHSVRICTFNIVHLLGMPHTINLMPDQHPAAEELLKALAGLASLESLTLTTNVVTDASMHMIARCSAMTQLRIPFHNITSSGWTSLAALPLKALHLHHPFTGEQQQVLLTAVTALTHLEVRFSVSKEAQRAALHPPTSLVTLVTQATPTYVGVMPHLTQLQQLKAGEYGPHMTAQQLVQLAHYCPALRTLVVPYVRWHAAAWTAPPLVGLTSLHCVHECITEADGPGDVELARLLPNLRRLDFSCGCYFKDDSYVFRGLRALEWLDMGAGEGPRINDDERFGWWHVSAGAMLTLASLPALTHLRVNAALDVMPHLSLLAALTSLSIRFDYCSLQEYFDGSDMLAAMAPPCLPPQLRALEVEFEAVGRGEVGDDYESVAAAVVTWVMHAPQLTSLRWGAYDEMTLPCCGMTDVWLWAAAANLSITHIIVWGQHRITPALLARLEVVHAARGLEIVVDDTMITGNG